MLLELVFCIFPYQMAKRAILKKYRNPPFAMSNIGIIDSKRLCFDSSSVVSAYITGSIKYSPFFQLALSTFKNQVTLSAAFHGTERDKGKIKHFLAAIDHELPCEDPKVNTNNM